jgi:hypothetical protein
MILKSFSPKNFGLKFRRKIIKRQGLKETRPFLCKIAKNNG